jgi:hypothetical protein
VTPCSLQRKMLPTSSLWFCAEDGGRIFLRNIGNHLQNYMVSQPWRPNSEISLPSKLQISCEWLFLDVFMTVLQATCVEYKIWYFLPSVCINQGSKWHKVLCKYSSRFSVSKEHLMGSFMSVFYSTVGAHCLDNVIRDYCCNNVLGNLCCISYSPGCPAYIIACDEEWRTPLEFQCTPKSTTSQCRMDTESRSFCQPTFEWMKGRSLGSDLDDTNITRLIWIHCKFSLKMQAWIISETI